MQFGPKRFLNIRERPYELLGLLALAFLLLSLTPSKVSLDLNMHDSYFVTQATFLCKLAAIYLLFIWMLYGVAEKILWTKWLTWAHVIFTITAITMVLLLVYLPNPLDGAPRRYYAFSDFEKMDRFVWTDYIPHVALIFFIAQTIFLLNIVSGLVKSLLRH